MASYIDRKHLESLIERHQRGLEDATDRFWRLINLQVWGEIFLSGNERHRPERREPLVSRG